MNRIKTVALVLLFICIVLSAGLVGELLSYQALEKKTDEKYSELYFRLLDEVRTAYEYYENWTRWKKAEVNQTEIYPENQQDFVDQHSALIELIRNYDPRKLETMVVHACIKADSNVSLPDVAHTYQQLRDGFAPYEVLILPEYNGNLNWKETLQWISKDFTGVSICLSVFEGGEYKLPDPNVKLGIEEIEEATVTSDVRMVRFAEMISWYMEANETFPFDEVKNVLEFCKSKNIKVLWSEWKISDNVLPLLKDIVDGYEDIVTVIYQTNNEFDAVFVGYLYATQFSHWGESVQSWWVDETGEDRYDLPSETVIEYAKLARSMGAEIIQFEPYWYFFDNGEPLEPMYALWSAI
jgi:hypothetical protein